MQIFGVFFSELVQKTNIKAYYHITIITKNPTTCSGVINKNVINAWGYFPMSYSQICNPTPCCGISLFCPACQQCNEIKYLWKRWHLKNVYTSDRKIIFLLKNTYKNGVYAIRFELELNYRPHPPRQNGRFSEVFWLNRRQTQIYMKL